MAMASSRPFERERDARRKADYLRFGLEHKPVGSRGGRRTLTKAVQRAMADGIIARCEVDTGEHRPKGHPWIVLALVSIVA